MVHQLDHVAIRVVNIGVVLATILSTSLVGVGSTDIRAGAGGRRARMGNAQLLEVGEHGLPVVNLHGEMAGADRGWVWGFREVHLATADAQLQLPLIERRTPIQKLRS